MLKYSKIKYFKQIIEENHAAKYKNVKLFVYCIYQNKFLKYIFFRGGEEGRRDNI